MKSKLLKKLRRQFAYQYQVKFELCGLLSGYHPFYALYTRRLNVFSNKQVWSLCQSFKTEAEVKEYLRGLYESFIEDYLCEKRTKRLRNKLTYPW